MATIYNAANYLKFLQHNLASAASTGNVSGIYDSMIVNPLGGEEGEAAAAAAKFQDVAQPDTGATNVSTSGKTPFQSGNAVGKTFGVIGGLSGLIGSYQSKMAQADMIRTQAPSSETDAFGRPTYNLNQFAAETAGVDPQAASFGEVASGALSGAAAGAQFGPIGAGVGALVGGIGEAIGGEDRYWEQRKKKRQAEISLRQSQRQYNNQMAAYIQQQNIRESYGSAQNLQNRAQNLYKFNNPYA